MGGSSPPRVLGRRGRGRSRRQRKGQAALGLGVSMGRGGERCCLVSHRDRRVNPNSLMFILEDVYCTRLGLLGLGLLEAGNIVCPPPEIIFWRRTSLANRLRK